VNEELYKTLRDANLVRAAEILSAGADINERDKHGETILDQIILDIDDISQRRAVISFMLGHGADPRLISPDGSGPLFSAVIAQDTEVLQMLLDYGADPNAEHDLGESLYSYAEFDYRFETYDMNLPEKPTEADKASEDTWLQFLDRVAVQHGKRRPDYLILLRQRGALTNPERQPNATGNV
jgi:ankyrin repeat protein